MSNTLELTIIHGDYGKDIDGRYPYEIYNCDDIDYACVEELGDDAFYIKNPIHLCHIARELSKYVKITPLDKFHGDLAVGFKTKKSAILIKLKDFRTWFNKYQSNNELKAKPELVDIANKISSLTFREQFCEDHNKYAFIYEQEL